MSDGSIEELQAAFNTELENLFVNCAVGRWWEDELGHELREQHADVLAELAKLRGLLDYTMGSLERWLDIDDIHELHRNLVNGVTRAALSDVPEPAP